MTIWGMRIACWIPKATNTHSDYTLLIAFPLQHWLHERARMLHFMYIAYLVCPGIDVSLWLFQVEGKQKAEINGNKPAKWRKTKT